MKKCYMKMTDEQLGRLEDGEAYDLCKKLHNDVVHHGLHAVKSFIAALTNDEKKIMYARCFLKPDDAITELTEQLYWREAIQLPTSQRIALADL